jgi:hypothetical protein
VPASETERHVDAVGGYVLVTTRGVDSTIVGDDECSIQLRELLERPAQLAIGDVRPFWRMSGKGIKNQRARTGQDVIGAAYGEQRPYVTPLAALQSNFHG